MLRLVDEGDAVLMDLRSFSDTNRGCTRELQHLVRNVPVGRWLLIVDGTTDEPCLERTLREAWQQVVAGVTSSRPGRASSAPAA